jgi:hypothetical protein
MHRITLSLALLLSATAPALAQDFESMQLANDLGTVLASEEPCGFTFDQAAIEAFIEDKVSADDMGFASTLSVMTQGQRIQIDKMSASSKTAHCTQIKRVAGSYGFLSR